MRKECVHACESEGDLVVDRNDDGNIGFRRDRRQRGRAHRNASGLTHGLLVIQHRPGREPDFGHVDRQPEMGDSRGNLVRREVTITLLDEKREPVQRWLIHDAWPTKYDPSDLNAKGNETLIELLELANERIERVL